MQAWYPQKPHHVHAMDPCKPAVAVSRDYVGLTNRPTGEEDPGNISAAPSQQSLERDTRKSVAENFSLPPPPTEGTQTASNVATPSKSPVAATSKKAAQTTALEKGIRGGASEHARLTIRDIFHSKKTRSIHVEHNKKHTGWQAADYPTFTEKVRSRLFAKLGFHSKQTSYATDSLDLDEPPEPIIYIPTRSGSQELSMSDSAGSPRQEKSLQLPCGNLDIRKTRTHMPPPHLK